MYRSLWLLSSQNSRTWANPEYIVSNAWLWFEYRICMLIISQIIFEFWEATGQLLFLTWHMVNENKQNKMKKHLSEHKSSP